MVGSIPHIITMVHVPLCQLVIQKNIAVQCCLISERPLLFRKLLAFLVRATCDEREWSVGGMILTEEDRSTGRETPLSVTLSSMNSLWTGLQLYLWIRS